MVFFNMWSVLNENPTREKILLLLKKNGPLSIDSLSKQLNITSMGIRQHLLSLERKGLIEYIVKRQGIGRPAFLYKLSEKAIDLFPMAYISFIVNLLKDVEKHEGSDKIGEIFNWHRNRVLGNAREALSDKKNIREKIDGFKDFLNSSGHIAEVLSLNNHYTLKIFSCPIYRIAMGYKEACQYDILLFRDLFGKDVVREECIVDGDTSCTYTIPINI
jgi:predicted ArsR family transcriptional regulator